MTDFFERRSESQQLDGQHSPGARAAVVAVPAAQRALALVCERRVARMK